MRIHLSLTPNNSVVPFNYQQHLTGAIHKWLGKNELHGDVSLYSFSWLKGGNKIDGGLDFPNGATWFISAFQNEIIKKIIQSIQKDPSFNFGMNVRDITIQENPKFKESETFPVASPVLIKRRKEESVHHLIFSDDEANNALTETIRRKLAKANLYPNGLEIKFKSDYHNPHTKLVDYKGIKNRASVCPVIIKGTPEQIAFTWNVGVGNSTGIGFGALK